MADDLKIPTAVLNADLVAPGSTNLDYISTPMPSADALNWFGKVPPDLSVIARARGVDYLYQYLKTFYSDPSKKDAPVEHGDLDLDGDIDDPESLLTKLPHIDGPCWAPVGTPI